jgi:hypothetical protein
MSAASAASPKRLPALTLIAALSMFGVTAGSAAPELSRAGVALPAEIWAVELDRAAASKATTRTLAGYRSQGINAVVVNRVRLGRATFRRLRAVAGRS